MFFHSFQIQIFWEFGIIIKISNMAMAKLPLTMKKGTEFKVHVEIGKFPYNIPRICEALMNPPQVIRMLPRTMAAVVL